MQVDSKQKTGTVRGAIPGIIAALRSNPRIAQGYALAVVAAISYAVAQVLVRQRIASVASPLAASVVTLFSGMAALWLINIRNLKVDLRTQRRGVIFFVLGGICSAIGVVCQFFALRAAPIVVVSPLVAINPLIALTLAHIFLQRLEKITVRMFIGAFLVVVGVMIISLAR